MMSDPKTPGGEAPPEPKVVDPVPEIINYIDFEKSPVEKPKPVIESLFDVSSRMIIGGGSKTFKTWVMSDLGITISIGGIWWGFRCTKCRVAYINFEIAPYHIKQRMKSIREARGIKLESMENFFIWNLRDWPQNAKALKEKLIECILKYKIEVILIDPFYMMLGERDERVSSELMSVFNIFSEINRETRASVICAAHFTKSGGNSRPDPHDRISGGAAFSRNPDVILTLTKPMSKLEEPGILFTTDIICRDYPPIDPFVVRWNFPLMNRTDISPEKMKESEKKESERYKAKPGRPEKCSPEALLAFIEDHDDEFTRAELVKILMGPGWKLSSDTAYEKIKFLIDNGKIFISKLTHNINIKGDRFVRPEHAE